MERYFAEIDGNNKVTQVIVFNSNTLPENASEKDWNSYCQKFSLNNSVWIETFIDNSYRNKYACIGDYYLPEKDIFIDPFWKNNLKIYKELLPNLNLVFTASLEAPENKNEITYPLFFDPFLPEHKMSIDLIAAIPPKNIFVDAGCGPGVSSMVASKLGWNNVIAFDRIDYVKKLDKIFKINNLNINLTQYEVNNFNPCYFGDAVLLNHTFEDQKIFFNAGFTKLPNTILLNCPTQYEEIIKMYEELSYSVKKELTIDDRKGFILELGGE